MKNKILINYNNIKLNTLRNSNLYEFLKTVFYDKTPHFCYNSKLPVSGNCRLCLVEIKGLQKPVVSCSLSLVNNITIFTITPFIKKARENVLEFLLTSHPLDCPVCDQGGECDLQDMSSEHGNSVSRFYTLKNAKSSIILSRNLDTNMSRCIVCTKCTRLSFHLGNTALHAIARSVQTSVEVLGQVQQHRYTLTLVDVCPVFELKPIDTNLLIPIFFGLLFLYALAQGDEQPKGHQCTCCDKYYHTLYEMRVEYVKKVYTFNDSRNLIGLPVCEDENEFSVYWITLGYTNPYKIAVDGVAIEQVFDLTRFEKNNPTKYQPKKLCAGCMNAWLDWVEQINDLKGTSFVRVTSKYNVRYLFPK